jgi:hypothetical protein
MKACWVNGRLAQKRSLRARRPRSQKKLNQFDGDFVNAEMVLAFISSPEYRARFGQP